MLYDAKSPAHLSKMELFYLSTAEDLATYRINKSILLQVIRQTGSSTHFGLLLVIHCYWLYERKQFSGVYNTFIYAGYLIFMPRTRPQDHRRCSVNSGIVEHSQSLVVSEKV